MFTTKNLSPKQLSALTALIVSVPVGFAFYVVEQLAWIGLVAFL
jgi:two-component system phosphate regulon sensor histidine kinase PhoR